ncbi:alpha/beta hydrolase fold domain-containing protein [Tepidibacter sp. Z1-5]|uniref:alpha/beta hydrolase fold domain-containing protein n=1 Tax=Tepidibacter sp. Z1-5 TaxID=3134138 RepID=UPI0030BC9710
MKRILIFIISIVFTMVFISGCSMNKATLKEVAKYKKEILLKNNQNTYKKDNVFEDITYKFVDGQELKLDIYMANVLDDEKRPAIVYVHGGFWAFGNKKSEIPYFKDLINILNNKGFTFVSIDYRLTNKNTKFPEPVKDVKDAIRWLRKNAVSYNIDENKIGICGNSAGGHLALLEGLTDDSMYLGNEDLKNISSKVNFIISFFGPTDLTLVKGKKYTATTKNLIGGTINDMKDIYINASPMYCLSENTPPILLIHGEKDTIVPISQSKALYEKSKSLGIDVEFVPVKNASHGLISTAGEINPSLNDITNKVILFIEDKFKNDN